MEKEKCALTECPRQILNVELYILYNGWCSVTVLIMNIC